MYFPKHREQCLSLLYILICIFMHNFFCLFKNWLSKILQLFLHFFWVFRNLLEGNFFNTPSCLQTVHQTKIWRGQSSVYIEVNIDQNASYIPFRSQLAEEIVCILWPDLSFGRLEKSIKHAAFLSLFPKSWTNAWSILQTEGHVL